MRVGVTMAIADYGWLRSKPWGDPDAACAAPGRQERMDRLALRRHRDLDWLRRGTWHGGNAACRAVGRSGRRRRCRTMTQSQRLAHLGVELGHDVLVVFEELAGILAALTDAFAFVAEP